MNFSTPLIATILSRITALMPIIASIACASGLCLACLRIVQVKPEEMSRRQALIMLGLWALIFVVALAHFLS